MGINVYFEGLRDRGSREDYSLVYNMLIKFFGIPKLNLRQVAQAIHRTGLVLASLSGNERTFALGAVVAIVLRTLDAELYRDFALGGKTDLDIIDSLFGHIGEDLFLDEYDRIIFEATIILGHLEISGVDVRGSKNFSSPLLNRYHKAIDREVSDGVAGAGDRYLNHAKEVTNAVRNDSTGYLRARVGFKHSVRRIELLSPGLKGDQPAEG